MSRQGTLQRRLSAGPILTAVLVWLLLLPVHAGAADQVGRVLVAFGDVTAVRDGESTRGLGRRDPIYEGDRIRTGTRGRVQIRFEDGALVDLDPASAFEVEEYATEEDEGGGSAVMGFLRGAMRTITGAIGGGDDDTYRMNTTVATIGVRGTAYALEYCDQACVDEGGRAGLYGRVDDGEVQVDGPGGTGAFGEGQYFFVPDGGAPERIVVPPDGILEGGGQGGDSGDGDERIEDVRIRPQGSDDDDGTGLGGGDDDTDLVNPGFESGEETELEEPDLGGDEDTVEPRPGDVGDLFFAGGFIGGEDGETREGAFILSPDDGEVRLDSDAVVGADFPDAGFVDPSEGTLNTGSTTVGFSPDEVDVQWGWWNGPLRFESASGEEDVSGPFVYAYTDPANITPTSALNNLADFATVPYGNLFDAGVVVDGPGGFDSSGGSWSVSTLGLDVDFPNLEPTLQALELTDSSTTIDMTGGNTVGSLNLDESTLQITGLGDTDGSYQGELQGVFLGPTADGLLLRFDLTGENDITGIIITEEAPN